MGLRVSMDCRDSRKQVHHICVFETLTKKARILKAYLMADFTEIQERICAKQYGKLYESWESIT